MKYILISFFAIVTGCNQNKITQAADIESDTAAMFVKTSTADIVSSINEVGKEDTAGLYLAPVKVISSRLIKKEYSNYKDIGLTYKNVSEKQIAGIRFKWYGKNTFNEPADMGGIIEGFGSGFTETKLRPGKTTNSQWDIFSKDGKTITLAYAYEVAFEDGTLWKLKD